VSTFSTMTARSSKPFDATKRVNYRFGLVLGADEFWQQDAYLREADWLAVRALHGYGTVSGLRIDLPAPGPDGPEVRVSAGVAVNPRGQFIHVSEMQCAKLNGWLGRVENRRKVAQFHSSPPVPSSPSPPSGPIRLYVLLSHQECETDPVTIPGGPCRTQEDSVAASRLADNFSLSFQLQPPVQVEERVVREFGRLLDSVAITAAAPAATEAIVRARVQALSPTTPDSGAQMRFPPAQAVGLLRAALHTWVTEVRPRILTSAKSSATGPSSEGGVLLASLTFSLASDWRVQGNAVTLDESERPLLVHTRMLQEWLMVTMG
jgi:hypothetical protein